MGFFCLCVFPPKIHMSHCRGGHAAPEVTSGRPPRCSWERTRFQVGHFPFKQLTFPACTHMPDTSVDTQSGRSETMLATLLSPFFRLGLSSTAPLISPLSPGQVCVLTHRAPVPLSRFPDKETEWLGPSYLLLTIPTIFRASVFLKSPKLPTVRISAEKGRDLTP